MTLRVFLLGDESTIAIVGWHLAVFTAFAIGWYLARLYHNSHYPRSAQCVRYGCGHRLPPLPGQPVAGSGKGHRGSAPGRPAGYKSS